MNHDSDIMTKTPEEQKYSILMKEIDKKPKKITDKEYERMLLDTT